MCDAGVAQEYRTSLNANLFGLADCPIESPVSADNSTAGTLAVSTLFRQSGADFGIAAAGDDIWGAGGQRDDEFGSIYRAGAVDSESSVVARVNSVNDVNAWAKTGVMIRNDIAEAGSSAGYAVTAVTRRNGIVFAWDSNGDGYLDSDARANVEYIPSGVGEADEGGFGGLRFVLVRRRELRPGRVARDPVRRGGRAGRRDLLHLARSLAVGDQRLQRHGRRLAGRTERRQSERTAAASAPR